MSKNKKFFLNLVGNKRTNIHAFRAEIEITGDDLQHMPDVGDRSLPDLIYKIWKTLDTR